MPPSREQVTSPCPQLCLSCKPSESFGLGFSFLGDFALLLLPFTLAKSSALHDPQQPGQPARCRPAKQALVHDKQMRNCPVSSVSTLSLPISQVSSPPDCGEEEPEHKPTDRPSGAAALCRVAVALKWASAPWQSRQQGAEELPYLRSPRVCDNSYPAASWQHI